MVFPNAFALYNLCTQVRNFVVSFLRYKPKAHVDVLQQVDLVILTF